MNIALTEERRKHLFRRKAKAKEINKYLNPHPPIIACASVLPGTLQRVIDD
jgi:hypothetical protein